MKTLKLRWVLFLALAAAPVLEAGTIYSYTGNDFTVFNGPYTGSDFETVSVTLSAPLPYNSSFTFYTPDAFSFSDGVDTLTDSTPDINSDGFGFATTNGVITTWYEYVWIGAGELPAIATCGDVISCSGLTLDQGQTTTNFAYNQEDAGTWTGATQAAPVPEPSPGIVTVTGVLLIAGTIQYRRRRRAMPRGL